jgi:hypothetical protein
MIENLVCTKNTRIGGSSQSSGQKKQYKDSLITRFHAI